jgi:hypothetical protein
MREKLNCMALRREKRVSTEGFYFAGTKRKADLI